MPTNPGLRVYRLAFRALFAFALVASVLLPARRAAAQAKPSTPDVLILANGDRITGKFVHEVGGTVTFHDDILGDISVPWAKVSELHTGSRVVVLTHAITARHLHQLPADLPQGTVAIANGMVTVNPGTNATIAPIPVANAQYIVDEADLQKQLFGHPSFTQGWNGGATVGITAVKATQNQFSMATSLALVRTIPTANWLSPRNRSELDFAQSYGKITQPAYTLPGGVVVPSTYTKSSILHFGGERDEYVSARAYYLGTVAFDHNYSQSLDLQQIYGGGIGYTAVKSPRQELDLKAVVQFERQSFSNVLPPSPSTHNLIGSTFGASYLRHVTKGILFTQQALYIPAWNDTSAWSFNESDTLTLPAYKNFSFSLGTLDTYLNDVPATLPPTQKNSFQFTTGITYNIKSSY